MKSLFGTLVSTLLCWNTAYADKVFCLNTMGGPTLAIPYYTTLVGTWPAGSGIPTEMTEGNLYDWSPGPSVTSITLVVNPGPSRTFRTFVIQNDALNVHGFFPMLPPCNPTFDYLADPIFHNGFEKR